ncbi:AI-2E family transporter [Neomegalonema sp.]|uniref:AI-2E family transporter n=1 Tax=Neomegalonema sp. TaxID=2039713 RepID=UPI002606BBA4|nr:AI-2E family transporter [Neomegalonema sp.]MDD2869524.1 AI-2E family transporter [Neomegalonema sp.]
MSVQRQFLTWGGLFLLFIGLFWALSSVIAPFLAGMAIAYFLDPLADRLERRGLSRLWATAIITLSLLAVLILAAALVGPAIGAQIGGLIASAPGWFDAGREWAMGLLGSTGILERLGLGGGGAGAAAAGAAETAAPSLERMGEVAATGGVRIAQTLLSGGVAAVGAVASFAIALVVAFYMLLDWDRMVSAIDAWLPRDHAPTIRRLAREIDGALSGFVRGQLLVCLILGSFYAVALTLAGLNYGLLIGVFAGFVSFIPFVGSASGFLLAMAVAATQFWGEDWLSMALVGGIFLFGQLVEGNFLSPKLVGGRVGLHPVLLIFALSAFGSLFGLAGMLVAVPAAAAIGVLARYALELYFDSRLYKGVAPDAQAEADAALGVIAVTNDPEKAEAAAVKAAVMQDIAREARGESAMGPHQTAPGPGAA